MENNMEINITHENIAKLLRENAKFTLKEVINMLTKNKENKGE